MKDTTLSDIDKIKSALGFVQVPSVSLLLNGFGLSSLPLPQRVGILFGVFTFLFTVVAVILLLYLGGSFKRMKDQAKNGDKPLPHENIRVRENRPLLLERLLETRDWMLKTNYPNRTLKNGTTAPLLEMLLNTAPANHGNILDAKVPIDDETAQAYQKSYVHAYHRCVDKPGQLPIPGNPEALYEAYARAYAGCGIHTKTSYRRSYARVYQTVSCKNMATMEFYENLFLERPRDLVGRTVRLEPLQPDRHAKSLYKVTSGEPYDKEEMQYNPNLIWAFLDYGPFQSAQEMEQCSELFHRGEGEAAFCIIDSALNTPCGVIFVTNDDPQNLVRA